MKLVFILILLILSLMAVVGVFLINSVVGFYIGEFSNQMSESFSDNQNFVEALRQAATEDNAPAQLAQVVEAYAAPLGIDGGQRKFFILDGGTGAYLGGNDPGDISIDLTPNILTALGGEVGYKLRETDAFFDCAVPFPGNSGSYIVYIRDTKANLRRLTSDLFMIVVQAVLFGLAISIVLSFFLSKTMSTPIENLTLSATKVASGDFSQPLEVRSTDEIGVLTRTFNNMARVLQETIETVESERDKFGALFQHMTDGVASFDRSGAIVHMNPAAIALLNLRFIEGMTYDQVLGHIAPFQDVMLLKPPEFIEHGVTIGNKHLQIFFAPFGGDTAEGGALAVIHDVTEQQRLDEVRREFVSNVSHELRTPLTNIRSYAETLTESSDIPMETIMGFAQVIVNEADRMTRLVRDLLTLSRFDYGQANWNPELFSFADSLQSVYDVMLLEAGRHGHKLTLDILPGLPDIWGDSSRIEQVLLNILSNAITYTPDGGLIELSAGQVADEIWCRVKDNGVGIPVEDLPRIFERFYRVDRARSRQSGGTGLGLAIAKEIIEAHHGYIDLQSHYGHGTVITMTLPISRNKPEETP